LNSATLTPILTHPYDSSNPPWTGSATVGGIVLGVIPCLPIYDSFIVPEECEKLLYDIMVEAYKEVDYYRFSPIIKKVE